MYTDVDGGMQSHFLTLDTLGGWNRPEMDILIGQFDFLCGMLVQWVKHSKQTHTLMNILTLWYLNWSLLTIFKKNSFSSLFVWPYVHRIQINELIWWQIWTNMNTFITINIFNPYKNLSGHSCVFFLTVKLTSIGLEIRCLNKKIVSWDIFFISLEAGWH